MKKSVSLLLALMILLSFCSCTDNGTPQDTEENRHESKNGETLQDMPYTPTESGDIFDYVRLTDGEPFVISSVGSFATLSHPDGEYDEVNTYCINSLTQTKRKNGLTWLENLTVLAYPGKA